MEYILGLLSGVVFFAVLGVVLFIGYKMGQRKHTPSQADEEEQRQIKQFDDSFKRMFRYDLDTALESKRVTDKWVIRT